MEVNDLGDQLKNLTLENIVPQNKELGHGAYGKVFAVDYVGLPCAAKRFTRSSFMASALKIRKRSKMVLYENVITPV